MARAVTFAKPFDYAVPGKPSVVAYEAGWSGSVPEAHAVAAEAAGVLAQPEKGGGKGEAGK